MSVPPCQMWTCKSVQPGDKYKPFASIVSSLCDGVRLTVPSSEMATLVSFSGTSKQTGLTLVSHRPMPPVLPVCWLRPSDSTAVALVIRTDMWSTWNIPGSADPVERDSQAASAMRVLFGCSVTAGKSRKKETTTMRWQVRPGNWSAELLDQSLANSEPPAIISAAKIRHRASHHARRLAALEPSVTHIVWELPGVPVYGRPGRASVGSCYFASRVSCGAVRQCFWRCGPCCCQIRMVACTDTACQHKVACSRGSQIRTVLPQRNRCCWETALLFHPTSE